MRTKLVATAGLALLGVGGGAFAVAVVLGTGLLARLGLAAMALGAVGCTLAILLVTRANHRLLRQQGRRLATLERTLGTVADGPGNASLASRLEELTEQLEAGHRDLRRTIDARVLGLHALLLDAGEETIRDDG